MPVLKTQLATLAYAPETDFDIAPESSTGTRIRAISEDLEPSNRNDLFGASLDGYVRSASFSQFKLASSFSAYLRSTDGVDLIKAAMRGKVATSGSAPFTHLIQTAARDYSFTFQRESIDCSVQLYHGCRVGGFEVVFPVDGNIRAKYDIEGTRETRPESALFDTLEEENRSPFFATDVFCTLNGSSVSSLISAGVEITSKVEIGRYSPVTQLAEEVWQQEVQSKIRISLYANSVEDLEMGEEDDLVSIEVGADDGEHSIVFAAADARVMQITRPFIAVGGYQQTIELACLPLEVTVVNDQSTI